mgnify:FL=1
MTAEEYYVENINGGKPLFDMSDYRPYHRWLESQWSLPLPDNNGVKEPDGYVGLDGEVNPFYKKPNKKLLDLLKKIFKDKLQPVYFSPPAKVEVDLHSKGLSILNSIWTKVNERLKEKDYPELLLSVDEEEEILSNAFNLPAKVEVSDIDNKIEDLMREHLWATESQVMGKDDLLFELRHLLSKK